MPNTKDCFLAGTILSAIVLGSVHAAPLDAAFAVAQAQQGEQEKEKKKREGYRVRYHDNWRTFVPLTALSVLAVGAATNYPYAYIDAPQPFCEGDC